MFRRKKYEPFAMCSGEGGLFSGLRGAGRLLEIMGGGSSRYLDIALHNSPEAALRKDFQALGEDFRRALRRHPGATR